MSDFEDDIFVEHAQKIVVSCIKSFGGGDHCGKAFLASHSPRKCPGKMLDHNTIILDEAECISGVSQEHLQQAR